MEASGAKEMSYAGGGSPVARVQLRRELVCGTLEIGQCFSVSNQRDDASSSL